MANATLADTTLMNVTESATNVTAPPSFSPSMSAAVADTRMVIQRVLTPVVMVLGVVGNLVSILVLTRRRMRSSTNSYLTALAVSDTLYLVVTFTLSLRHSVSGITHPDYRLYWHYWPIGLWLVDAAGESRTEIGPVSLPLPLRSALSVAPPMTVEWRERHRTLEYRNISSLSPFWASYVAFHSFAPQMLPINTFFPTNNGQLSKLFEHRNTARYSIQRSAHSDWRIC